MFFMWNVEHKTGLQNDLREFVNNSNFSDVVFRVEGAPIRAHKVVLRQESNKIKYIPNDIL